jgi:cytochrome c oxidase subunit 4
MATAAHAHPSGNRQYIITWVWLLVMTLLALSVGYVQSIPHGLKALILVGITLAKIGLIGAIFMHLKFERMNLVMLTFSPLVLSVILFFFTFGETRGNDPSHVISVRRANNVVASEKAH